tara:strand:- start:869 stop:1912 length:1044 start_codon:yes stop_codon:yes gene_type:complete
MTFDKRINAIRRSLMRSLTKSIGQAAPHQSSKLHAASEVKKILVIRPNHRLGNLLLITPLIQDISNHFPEAKIDLFVKGGLAPLVFKNYNQFHKFIELPKKPLKSLGKYLNGWLNVKSGNYDMVINVIDGSSSGRIAAKLANAKFKFFGNANTDFSAQFTDYGLMAKSPVYNFRYFLQESGFAPGSLPVPNLDLKLSRSELSQGELLLKNLVQNNQKVICLFTNATGDKIYDTTWWEDLYARLESEFKDHTIIELLPVEKTSQLSFKAPTYFNPDIRISGSVIANAGVFIAADSGMMHLACAVNAPTVGLFKVTGTDMYAPYHERSAAIDTNTQSMDDIIAAIKKII